MNMRVWYLNLILCFCTFTFNVNFYLGWQNSRRACRLIATSRRIDRLYCLPYFSISSVSACYSARDRKTEYYDERVCVCVSVCLPVCLSTIISSELHVRSSPKFLCVLSVTVARSSLLWRRRDTLCTSGFMDDVIFAHKPRLLDVTAAQLKRSVHAALGLAIKCAQWYHLQANGRTGLLFGRMK